MACLAEKILTVAAAGEDNPEILRRIAVDKLIESCRNCGACEGRHEAAMERFAHNENIRRHREVLEEEPDEAKRKNIQRLLAEEEAKTISPSPVGAMARINANNDG